MFSEAILVLCVLAVGLNFMDLRLLLLSGLALIILGVISPALPELVEHSEFILMACVLEGVFAVLAWMIKAPPARFIAAYCVANIILHLSSYSYFLKYADLPVWYDPLLMVHEGCQVALLLLYSAPISRLLLLAAERFKRGEGDGPYQRIHGTR